MNELTNEQRDAIAAYLGGWMPTNERPRFEQELTENALLSQELALERNLLRGMQLLAYEREAANLIQKARAHRTGSQPPVVPQPVPERARASRPRAFPMGWVAAASLVLLLGIGWLFWWQQEPVIGPGPVAQTDSTRTTPTTPDTSRIVTPVEIPNPDVLLAEANQRLSNAYFSDTPKPAPAFIAGEDLDADPRTDSTAIARDSVRVWRGARLLGRGQAREAADSLLKTVVQGYPGHWRATAEWYLSLAYLRQNQRQQARPILNRIARTNGHPYQADAKKLRVELRP